MRPAISASGLSWKAAFAVILFLLCTHVHSASSHAQDLQLPEQSYVNEFARPGQPTMTLYLWGAVGTTGIWRVERDVDLIQLLSVRSPACRAWARRNRMCASGLSSTSIGSRAGSAQQIYEEEVENLIGGGAAPVPALQDGDILAVETQTAPHRLNFVYSRPCARCRRSCPSICSCGVSFNAIKFLISHYSESLI